MSNWSWTQGNEMSGNDGEMMDSENQTKVEGLSSNVSRLKSMAFDIEQEAKDQNTYLDDVGGDFASSEGLLGGSVKRLSNMVGSGKTNRKLMCYIIAGLVILFIIAYFVLSRVRA